MEYHGPEVDFRDGEAKDVPEPLAAYLLKDFGGFFTEVVERKAVGKPPVNRMVKRRQVRTKRIK